MGNFPREEVEAAFEEFKRRGQGSYDWPGWAKVFTDDAHYEEPVYGVFDGQQAIEGFIVPAMEQFAALTIWIEWAIIDGDRVGFYIWNNLPDPTGEGKRWGFPNTTFITYAGDGKWSEELDFYNPPEADKAVGAWMKAGGRLDMAQDRSLQGFEEWNPEPPEPAFPREEVEAEFLKYRERGAHAVATGDWVQWADQFTDDAEYREHHYGYFKGKQAITDWITGVMQPFPTMEFPVKWALIDGNRVSALIPNILPPPAGDDGYYGFDVNTILHYAGNGKWSFEEDVYSVKAAEEAVKRWVAAGGVVPR
jgi:predicted SnoaL-like aldol condensation-catalyzing enzyme